MKGFFFFLIKDCFWCKISEQIINTAMFSYIDKKHGWTNLS